MELLWFLMIGVVAGWLAGKLSRGTGFGLVGNLLLGIVGAVVGGFFSSLVGLNAVGTIGRIIVATVGALLLVFLVNLIKKK